MPSPLFAVLRHARWLIRLRQLPPRLLAGALLCTGMAITAFAWQASRSNSEAVARAHFDSSAEIIANSISRRMIGHEQVLRGGAALFNMNNALSREQWRTYVSSLRLDETYPGLLGVGFSLRIPADQLQQHITRVRAEGFPDYTVRPLAAREQYHSIIYLEPFWGRNLRAFGYDMMTESVRRTALERARDSGEATLSGRVTLVQENQQEPQYGVLLYIPVYRSDLPRATVEEKRAALLGHVYSPLRIDDMMRSVLARNESSIATDVYDAAATDVEHLLTNHGRRQGRYGKFSSVHRLSFAGTTWTVVSTSLPGFEALFDSMSSKLVLLAGTVLTLLVTLLFTKLATARNLADGMARDMNHQLARSESQLRSVLESAADGILSVDSQGQVRSANSAAEHIFGRSGAQLAGIGLVHIIKDLDLDGLAAMFDRYGNAGSVNCNARFEAQGLRASGETFPLAVSLGKLNVDGETSYSLMVRDITDEKMAEAVLQLRLRAIEAASNGIVIADMTLPTQPIIYANPAFARITGYDTGDIVGHNCKLLQGADSDPATVATLAEAIAKGQSCQVLVCNYRKDGSLFWNDLSVSPVRDQDGRITHYVGSQTDVSDRVLAERALQERTRRLDAIFALSPDGFVAFDAEGRLSNVNPAFLRMSGLSETALQQLSEREFEQRLAALCDPQQPEELIHAAGDAPLRHTLYLNSPTKRIVQRSVRIADNGSLERVMYFRDVTHETEVDRMKSEFLSTAAHELRTPMASIYGFSELLLKRQYDDATRLDVLGTINRQAKVLINLINELLDLARIEARAGKEFNCVVQALPPLFAQAMALLPANPDGRQVTVIVPHDLPLVRVDAEKLIQALSNVLTNAFKYSPGGGAVELSVAMQGPQIGIRIRDYGIGLAPHHLARLFERFFRADPSGNIPGTGLGLCIVKEIIELHGGQVEVDSETGQGTTVTLWLPVATAQLEAA